MSKLEVITHITTDNRKLICWLNLPAGDQKIKSIAILTPGFGKRMHQHSALTCYLVNNGIAVFRFDSLNHTGLSDGSILDFTLSEGMKSLKEAIKVVLTRFSDVDVKLIATSMTARIALRCYCEEPKISKLIAISGIVNVKDTLALSLGTDYSTWPESQLPETITFESQKVKTAPWYDDCNQANWRSLDDTLSEIAKIDRPVHWFVGTDDEWINSNEIILCSETNELSFMVTWLDNCRHDIGRNSSASRVMMKQIVSLCSPDGLVHRDLVLEPSYTQLLEIALNERRMQRNSKS